LRFNREGAVVVTVPRGGNRREPAAFVEEHRRWILQHAQQRASVSGYRNEWREGQAVLFRGEPAKLRLGTHFGRPIVLLADEKIFIADPDANLRRPVEQRLIELARSELPKRTRAMADAHDVSIHSVSVRNQSSRWGSCSDRGVISLNWRLVQTPFWVRDDIIVHELMHRREMNHSIRFWRLVAKASPRWRDAEAWISQNAFELGF
jgi:predicted metal-dependent hydrolase